MLIEEVLMSLEYRKTEDVNYYVYYPDIEKHSPFRRYSLIFLRDDNSRECVDELISLWNLDEFALTQNCVLAFPNAPEGGWEKCSDQETIEYLQKIQQKMCEPEDFVLETNEVGIPTLECMISRWHLMNDTRYYVALGKQIHIACRFASAAPVDLAAICVIGEIDESDRNEMNKIGMPVIEMETTKFDFNEMYEKNMKTIRRMNTGKYGDTGARMNFDQVKFDYYIRDCRLGDQNGIEHTWFVHVPFQTRKNIPMVIFFHGGSDNPAEAAEMSKLHELGNREGFMTVYPWGSDTASWNCNYDADGKDDVAYIHTLIAWLKRHYPVDENRIYLSGFSNGAAMAQVYAMEYPEEIAGLFHIDSNWPGHRLGFANVLPEDVIAFRKGLNRKKEYNYLMPIWYTYGTREPSYPVYRGCSQQLQYDYWKEYNHIPVIETPGKDCPHPCGCGVMGDVCEQIYPLAEYPEHRYQINRFYSDEKMNLYNYVMMHDKGHDVAPADPVLGWNYVKQFKRLSDGAIVVIEE